MKNEYHRLRKLFQLATGILASRAYGCGVCPPSYDHDVVYNQPANGDAGSDAGGDGGLPTLDQATCDKICEGSTISCSYASTDASGAVVVRCVQAISCGAGRRPAGFEDAAGLGASSLGVWLAEIARLEAASITAFRVLERELASMGAPSSLRRRARAAAADEVRHARTVARLARSRGGRVRRTHLGRSRREPRSLRAIAVENAVEGCVRETFAALVATAQAERAQDPELRRAFRAIARDETRHAALAHAVDRHLQERLSPEDRALVERARHEALARLVDEAPIHLGDGARREAGIPEAGELRAMARVLAEGLANA